ncbi:MAG: hypothetical protein ABIH23_13685 [bacterium]
MAINIRTDNLLELLRESDIAYWCKYCGRHLQNLGGVFVHDNKPHPLDYTPESGEEKAV